MVELPPKDSHLATPKRNKRPAVTGVTSVRRVRALALYVHEHSRVMAC